MTTISVTRKAEKATAILKAIRQIDEGAELRPVVHGRWVRKPITFLGEFMREDVVCSACGDEALETTAGGGGIEFTKYCPNCGAKMDLEAADGQN